MNHKGISSGGKILTKEEKIDRNNQFDYIAKLREKSAENKIPIISVDTKKKEKVGNFKNEGATYERQGKSTYDHDFESYAIGKFIPYGVYDAVCNLGTIFGGVSADTPLFAVEVIEKWWRYEGEKRYPKAHSIYILADAGGSNGCRSRAWKYEIQNKLCDIHGLSVTISHYPAGVSKWNPIEHRLFSEISKNWQGEPLVCYEKALNFTKITKTSTGMKVKVHLVDKYYEKNVTISDREMESISLKRHHVLPKLNYTITPRIG